MLKYTTSYLLTKGPHNIQHQNILIQSSRLLILSAFLLLLYVDHFYLFFLLLKIKNDLSINFYFYAKAMYHSPVQVRILDLGRHCALPAQFL